MLGNVVQVWRRQRQEAPPQGRVGRGVGERGSGAVQHFCCCDSLRKAAQGRQALSGSQFCVTAVTVGKQRRELKTPHP